MKNKLIIFVSHYLGFIIIWIIISNMIGSFSRITTIMLYKLFKHIFLVIFDKIFIF